MSLFSRISSWSRLALAAAGCAGAVIVAGCAGGPTTGSTATQVAPTAVQAERYSVNWPGRYIGSSRCPSNAPAGCTGIDMVLTLNGSNTYTLSTTIKRRSQPYSFTSNGRFRWDASNSVIQLASKDENMRLSVGRAGLTRISTDIMSEAEAQRNLLVFRKF